MIPWKSPQKNIQKNCTVTYLVGAQPPPCCSFVRHLAGKMVIYCSFAHHDSHSPVFVAFALFWGCLSENVRLKTGEHLPNNSWDENKTQQGSLYYQPKLHALLFTGIPSKLPYICINFGFPPKKGKISWLLPNHKMVNSPFIRPFQFGCLTRFLNSDVSIHHPLGLKAPAS